MRFPKPLQNRSVKIVLISFLILSALYLILRIAFFENDPVLPFLKSVYHFYLFLPENIAGFIFDSAGTNVKIIDHHLVFDTQGAYHDSYSKYISNWPEYLFYKKWVVLILLLIWCTYSSFKRKSLFSILFVIVHIASMVGGLILLAIIGPRYIDEDTQFFLSPTLAGTLLFYLFVLFWVSTSKNDIRKTISKIGINLSISDRTFTEILSLFFLLLLLKDFLIPFFAFKPYVIFLLRVSQALAGLFGFEGYIIGDQLIGAAGALALSKHCLGFMTMYIFASLIFITRPDNRSITVKYMAIGTVAIFAANLLRLFLVFIVAQGENGYDRANLHHEIYNIAIYILIFLLWVLWFEVILRKKKFFK